MPRSASTLAGEFGSQAASLLRYVDRMEGLLRQGRLRLIDMPRVYSGAYLLLYTQAERTIEQVFVGLLTGRITTSQPCRPLVRIRNFPIAQGVIASERAFADWLPYDKTTLKRAKAYFDGGRPFSGMSKADRKVLEDASTIRNAVAHASHHAIKRFQSELTAGKSLPPAQQLPAGYLRGRHAGAQTRLAFLAGEVAGVVQRLCH